MRGKRSNSNVEDTVHTTIAVVLRPRQGGIEPVLSVGQERGAEFWVERHKRWELPRFKIPKCVAFVRVVGNATR